MIFIPVILIKDSTASFQSDLSESAQYMLASKLSKLSEPSEPSAHQKALFQYIVLQVSIPVMNMYLNQTYSSDDCDEDENLETITNCIRRCIWICI
jgi:hypothetical protein